MRKILITIVLLVSAPLAFAQTTHEYASVEFSPALRKMGVFSTTAPGKVVDMKPIHMDKSAMDIITFFNEVQDMEQQGWEVTSQEIVALEKGHMYVWTLRKPKQ